jgi:hypothetical protein
MNERIKELIEQATETVDVSELGMPETYLVFNKEKFTELIVRECRDMFVVNSPSWNLLNEKLEDFGVEE